MNERSEKKLFPNPFYVLLLVASCLFVVTTLAYLVVPSVLAQADEPGRDMDGSAGAVQVLDSFNRGAPAWLAVECAMMIVTGLLAMATDRWFTPAAKKAVDQTEETGTTPPAP